MKILIVFAFVMVNMAVNAKTGDYGRFYKTHEDKCLLNTQCGSPGGLFTDFCNVVCRAGGFKGSTCTNFRGQGQAICSCEGKGDSEKFLKANCGFLCKIGCDSCGYKESSCSSAPLTVKSAITCTCSHRKS